MRKIGDFKNNALQVERVSKILKILNSFETMLKMKKNDVNIFKKMYFFGFFLVFRYFWIFLKIL
jgi:hypothetical protein